MKKTSKEVSPVVGFGVLIVLMLALAVILFKTATGEIAFASILGKKVVTIALMVSMAVVAIIMTNVWKRWRGTTVSDEHRDSELSVVEKTETTTTDAPTLVDFSKLDPKDRRKIREAEEQLEGSMLAFAEKRRELREDSKSLEEVKAKSDELLAEAKEALK